MKACEVIVEERTQQLKACEDELFDKLVEGFHTERELAKLHKTESLFKEYVRVSHSEGVGDKEASEIVDRLLEKAKDAPVKAAGKRDGKGKGAAKGLAKLSAKSKGKGKADDGLTEEQKQAVWEHREHTHEIRRITKELTGRVRSLRYFTVVRDLQKQRDTPPKVKCDSSRCNGRELPLDEIAVLSSCGHMGCLECVTAHAAREECIYADHTEDKDEDVAMLDADGRKKKAVSQSKTACRAAARVINIVKGDTLGVDDAARDANAKHYGMKLEKVLQLIK